MPPNPVFLGAGGEVAGHSTSSDEVSDDSAATTGDYSVGLFAGLSIQSLPSVPSLQRLCVSPPTNTTADASSFSYRLFTTLLPNSSNPISALAVSPSAGLLYAAAGGEVRAYDLVSLAEIAAFNLSGDGAVKSLAFSDDGLILTGHQDCKVRVWRPGNDGRRHRLVATLPTPYDWILRAFWPRNYVRVRRHRRRLWVEHADAVSGLVAGNGRLFYSVSWDRTLKLWGGKDFRCVESVAAHDDAVNCVAVAGDGTVYTGSADCRIRVWRKEGGSKKHNLVATLVRHRSAVNALAIAGAGSTGDVLYSGAGDRSILVWEREDTASYMSVVGALRGHRGAVLCLACAGEGAAVVVSGSEDRTVRVWRRRGDAADGGRWYDCMAVLEGHARAVRAVVVTPERETAPELEGFSVCSGSLNGEIKIWKIRIASSSYSKTHNTNETLSDHKL